MNYMQKVWQIIFDLEYAVGLIRAGIPNEDVNSKKYYIVSVFHDVEFWTFRLPKEDKEAAEELLQEVKREYARSWDSVLTSAERKCYSK